MDSEEINIQLVEEVISNSLSGLMIISDGYFIYTNKDVYKFMGYSVSELKGKSLNDIIQMMHPEDRRKIELLANKFENGEKVYSFIKFRFIQKDNSYVKFTGIAESINYCGKNFLKVNLDTSGSKIYSDYYRNYDLKNFFENTNQGIASIEFINGIDVSQPIKNILENIYKNGYISYANEIFSKAYGYKEEELDGRRMNSIFQGDDAEYFISVFQKFIESNYRLRDYEVVFTTKRGKTINFLINLDGVIDNGILKVIWGSQSDITEKKHSEKLRNVIYQITEFTNSVKSVDELFSVLHEVVWSFMPAQNFYIALYDQKKQTLSFPYFRDKYTEESEERNFGNGLTEYVIKTGRPLLATPETFSELMKKGEVNLIGQDSIDWLGVPLKIRNVTIGALVVQSYDANVRYDEEDAEILTILSEYAAIAIERKTNEELLVKNESRYRAFIEQSLEGIYYISYSKPIDLSLPIDEQVRQIYSMGIILDCNDIFASMYGYHTKLDMIGRNLLNLYSKDDLSVNLKVLEDFVKNNYIGKNFETIRIDDSGELHVFINNVVGTVEDGYMIGYWGRQIDITEQKKAEKSNEIINSFLKAANASEEILLVEKNYSMGIKNALLKIGNSVETEEVGIYENIYDIKAKKHLIRENINLRVSAENEIVNQNHPDDIEFPFSWFEDLYKGNNIYININDIPDKEEKSILKKWGATNVLLLPILTGGILWGFVKFRNIYLDKLFGETELSVLRSFANAIGGAINKEISEKESKENESRMRGVLSALPDIMIVLNEDYFAVDYFANSPELEFLQPDKLLMKKITDILDKENSDMLKAALDNSKLTHKVCIITREVTKEKKKFYLEARVVFCEDGKYIVIIRNITDEYQQILEIEKLYKAIEQSSSMVMIINKDNVVEYVNNKYLEVTGYNKEEIIGQNADDLRDYGDSADAYLLMKQTLQNGDIWHGEYLAKKKNGETFWCYESISPIKNEKNEIVNYISIREDVSERKQMLEDLIVSKEKAEEAVRLRDNFLANMSHELRTPLHGILGFSQLLSETLQDDELKMMSETINNSATRLLDTLNLILNLSKTESGTFELNLVETNINNVIKQATEIFEQRAKEKKLYLKTYFLFDPINANIDERLFREILTYLLNNAIKFTERGGIIVETSINNEFFEMKVVDTGIGIPKDKFEIIFEEFRQESEGYSRSFEGTGLGLTLAKKYTEIMGGNIYVDSEVGKGSVFTVRLPLNLKKDTSSSKENIADNISDIAGAASQKKILLVENDSINANLVRFYLKGKYYLSVATNMDEALEHIADENYDLILMDINLGNSINGVEGLKIIKGRLGINSIPIAAVTAYTMKGDKERLLAEGFDYYLPKPFDKKKLLSFIDLIFKK